MCRRVSQIHADRARTVLGADATQPLPDLAEGFVPADRLEPIADAAYRRAEPIRIVVQRSHRRGLGTDISLGQHIVGISLDPDDAVAFDGDPDSAVRLTPGALSSTNASIHGTSSHAGHLAAYRRPRPRYSPAGSAVTARGSRRAGCGRHGRPYARTAGRSCDRRRDGAPRYPHRTDPARAW